MNSTNPVSSSKGFSHFLFNSALPFLRAFFWPMKKDEVKKVLSMFFILFFILFNYSTLRMCKDSLLLNASPAGADAIPFVKIWGITPMAFLLTSLHLRLSNFFSRDIVFHLMTSTFLIFFALFSFILFPNLDLISLDTAADFMNTHLPKGFYGFITMVQYWPISLFYILSELWASLVMSLLFWGFVNDITSITDAKRFYGFLALGGHLSFYFSGELVAYYINSYHGLSYEENLYSLLRALATVLTISGGMILILFQYTSNLVKKDRDYLIRVEKDKQKRKGAKKPRISLFESIKYLMKQPYLRDLAIMVFAYGFTINLIEVSWKAQIKQLFSNSIEYLGYMSRLHIYQSITSVFLLLFCSPVLKKWGWGVTALFAPIVMLISGLLFYGISIFTDFGILATTFMGLSPLALAVSVGFWQNNFSKSAKNTLFNITKEMAYIPLDSETRLQGKAAIDVLGERVGKLGGAGVSMFLIFLFGSASSTTPYAGIFMVIVSLMWVKSTISLKKQFENITREDDEIEEEARLKLPAQKEAENFSAGHYKTPNQKKDIGQKFHEKDHKSI